MRATLPATDLLYFAICAAGQPAQRIFFYCDNDRLTDQATDPVLLGLAALVEGQRFAGAYATLRPLVEQLAGQGYALEAEAF